MIGDILWSPPADLATSTEIGRYMTWLGRERGRTLRSYDELWQWSVDDLEGFWSSIWDFFGIRAHTPVRPRARDADDAGRADGSAAPV